MLCRWTAYDLPIRQGGARVLLGMALGASIGVVGRSRFLAFINRLGWAFNGIILLVAVVSGIATIIATVGGRWLEALVGAIMSAVWLAFWWGSKESLTQSAAGLRRDQPQDES